MCKVLKISARFLKILQGSSRFEFQDNLPKCTGVILSHAKSCRSHFLNPHLDCNLDVIFAEVGNVHLEFFKLTPFSRKLSRDRRSQTIGSSQVHIITLTITMVCRHNISFLQNSSHHCHPIDFPWKYWKSGRCWLLGGRLATEPTRSSLQTEQQPDQTHTDWGWALSYRGSWPQKILLEHQKYSRITENIIMGPRGHT